MPAPPIRSTTLYPRNSPTVDTGTGIDIRRFAGSNAGATDATQTVTATHTQDNAERTFDPATAGVTAADNALSLQREGWAVTDADFDPADPTRCVAVLPAGSGTLTVTVNAARDSVPLADTTGVLFRASLWRYNVVTNSGSLIDSASSAAQTFGLLLNANETKSADIALSWSEVTFTADETLMLQVGLNTGTLGNPLTGTITYTFALHIDNSTVTRFVFAGTSLRVRCSEAPVGALTLGGTYARTLTLARSFGGTLTLGGTYARLLTLARSFLGGLTLGGAYSRLLTLTRARTGFLDLNGARQPWAISLGRDDLKAQLDLNGQRVVRALTKVPYVGTLTLGATYTRALTLARSFLGTLDLNGAFSRVIIFGRHFIGGLTLGASWLVQISQAILNRMVSGGTTIIKKLFFIGD